MIKDFLMKKMLKRQLKDVPQGQRDQIIEAVSKNPELFKKIGDEIKREVKKGKPQMAVTMEVMRKYQGALQKTMKQTSK